MRRLKFLAPAALALSLAALPAAAQQNQLWLSTTDPGAPGNQFLGTGGIADLISKAIQALGSSNEGTSAPANAIGGTPFTYQLWFNTTASPPKWEIWDGSQWDSFATLSSSTHVFAMLGATLAPPITAATDISTPDVHLDWIPIVDHTTGALKKTNSSEMQTAVGGGVSSLGGAAGVIGLGAGVEMSGPTLLADPTYLRGLIGGLGLAYGSSSTFTANAGAATSDDATTLMKLSTGYTKSTSSWTVGSGNGALDVGSVGASLWYHDYLIERTDTGVVDDLLSLSPTTTIAGTWSGLLSIGTPGVFSWPNHGAQVGSAFSCSGGTPPTGLSNGTTYYVIGAGLTVGQFEFSASQGGGAINTSGSESSSGTCAFSPTLPANYTKKRRIGSIETDGSGNVLCFVQNGDEFLWCVPTADVSVNNLGTSAVLYQLNVPPGVSVAVLMNAGIASAGTATGLISSPLVSDEAPGTPAGNINLRAQSAGLTAYNPLSVRTNQSQQIRARSNGASTGLNIATYGWVDPRGAY